MQTNTYIADCEKRFVDILCRLRAGLDELTKDAPGHSVIKNGQLFIRVGVAPWGYLLVDGHRGAAKATSSGAAIKTEEELEKAFKELCQQILAESTQPIQDFEIRLEAGKPTEDRGLLAYTGAGMHLEVQDDGTLQKPSWESKPVWIGSATKAYYQGIY